MSDLKPPEQLRFQKYLNNSVYSDIIFKALEQDDPSEVVIKWMDVLNAISDLDFRREEKSEVLSNVYTHSIHRNDGNYAYTGKNFRLALEKYNKALLYAPLNSQSMKLAYSNRSALLFTVKAFSACINDIETFFSMGCTDYKLAQRLRQRKRDCLLHTRAENESNSGDKFQENFFKLNVRRHPKIPCASAADVTVVTDDLGLPKIVAARDIPAGTVVAVEKPFVSQLDPENNYNSCYYCHKMTFNLIPCDGCCVALFCDEECKSKCNIAFHSVECMIMVCIKGVYARPSSVMKIKAALKIRRMCKSWKEFIAASYNIGEDRMRYSSVSDVFDGGNKFSLLSYNNPKHFIHGERYGASFSCALVLLHLAHIATTFLPKDRDEKVAAIRAFARVMMNLYTSYPQIELLSSGKDTYQDKFTTNTDYNYGWFAFAGKLKHRCDANMLVLAVKNNAALVALQPIKKGDELTISYFGHYYENIIPNRTFRIFCIFQEVCRCKVCVEKWSLRKFRKLKLSPEQKKAHRDWASSMGRLYLLDRAEEKFKAICEGLTALADASGTEQHFDMYRELRSLLSFCQFQVTHDHFLQLTI